MNAYFCAVKRRNVQGCRGTQFPCRVSKGQSPLAHYFFCSFSQIWSLSWLMLPQPMVSTKSPGCQ